MNINPYLSFLQRPCVAIFLQTFRFNSELNNGIPKHSSRGTQSASVVATTKRYIIINYMCIYIYHNWPGLLNWHPEIFRFLPPLGSASGLSRGEDSEGVSESLQQERVFEYVRASGEKVHSFHQMLQMASYQKTLQDSYKIKEFNRGQMKLKSFFSGHIFFTLSSLKILNI